MPDLAGPIGLGLLVAAAALLVASLLALVPRVLRVRRRALALQAAVAAAEGEALVALARLRAGRAETDALLVPWRRLRRWARHPLVVATLDWYRRRRRAARRGAHG